MKNTFQTAKPEAHLAKTGQSLSNTEGERGIVSTEHSVARGSSYSMSMKETSARAYSVHLYQFYLLRA